AACCPGGAARRAPAPQPAAGVARAPARWSVRTPAPALAGGGPAAPGPRHGPGRDPALSRSGFVPGSLEPPTCDPGILRAVPAVAQDAALRPAARGSPLPPPT